ncbi:type IV pilus modification PilV family protein [Salisediminibacterium halotolerans]|uniref:Prepilin-type N-terminal cleavage/methylation domain-containing protein n=1 Tax=Salisediminibacterium halotolerans TaxID=517425 RepID=A0A1H9TVA5_9BACI|nr:prepilin-type N-terminal cleavage/methylation domain-containing protein [Salisediminibacterium haloalkalitolerans]SES00884.1 prepilin-type N-terminal cleavage/methylation domain-containing protein [Salisediminibacterium haloalkalitolerans]
MQKKNAKKCRNQNGFTLIEILAALVILSIVSLVFFQTLGQTLFSSEEVSHRQTAIHLSESILNQTGENREQLPPISLGERETWLSPEDGLPGLDVQVEGEDRYVVRNGERFDLEVVLDRTDERHEEGLVTVIARVVHEEENRSAENVRLVRLTEEGEGA